MSLIVDASVAAKWVLDEEGSDRANALRSEIDLLAPSLIAAEVGNALWKAARRRSISRAQANFAVGMILRPFDRIVSTAELSGQALQVAIDTDHPIYDCFYIALAQRENAPLITADERQVAAARRAKVDVQRL